jgi:hypothetical protein
MGLLIKGDFETNYGKTNAIYARVEGFHFSRTTAILRFQVTYWYNISFAKQFSRQYFDDAPSKPTGLISERVIMFTDSKEKEFIFKHSYENFIVRGVETEVPQYKTVEEEITDSYLSFDENGNEVIKTNKKIIKKQVQDGTKIELKHRIDLNLLGNIFTRCYHTLRNDLLNSFSSEDISDI